MILVGRDSELPTLSTLLTGDRLLQLTGVAGIGKSAAATALAAGRPTRWLDLVGVRASSELARRWSAAVGDGHHPPDLLVLDGADDLDDDAVATLILRLAERPGEALITTRQPLAIPGASHRLGPLRPEDGARLLRSSVGHLGRAATLPEDGLRELSRALGGRPQALLLAAPSLRLHSVAVLLERVRASTSERSPVPAASAAITTRLAQLSTESREALDHAALIDGPVDSDHLEELCGRALTSILFELLDAGLMETWPASDTTLRVPPLVRSELTRPADADLAFARLAERRLPAWEQLAADLAGPDSADAMASLRRSRPALEAIARAGHPDHALRAALVLGRWEQRAGPAARTLQRDAILPPGGDPLLRARQATLAAQAAKRLRQHSWGLDRIGRDPAPIGTTEEVDQWSVSCLLHDGLGNLEDARRLRSRALAAAEAGGVEPQVLYRVAVGAFWAGELATADAALDIVLRERGVERDVHRYVQALILAAVVRRERGRPSEVLLPGLETVDRLWRQSGYREQGPQALVLRAVLLADTERWTEAGETLDEAADLLDELGRFAEAAAQRFQRMSMDFQRGQVPVRMLEPVPEEGRMDALLRAEISAWRAVVLATQGARVEVRDRLVRVFETLRAGGREARGTELVLFAAAALRGVDAQAGEDPDAVETLLDLARPVPHHRELLRLIEATGDPRDGAGQDEADAPPPAPRWESHLVRALLRRGQRARVALDGSWFEPPAGDRVPLARRRVLRRLLAALAASDDPVGIEELVAQGWPGQTLVGDSGRRRVEVALSTLRGLGLNPWLETLHGPQGTRWRLDAVVEPTAT